MIESEHIKALCPSFNIRGLRLCVFASLRELFSVSWSSFIEPDDRSPYSPVSDLRAAFPGDLAANSRPSAGARNVGSRLLQRLGRLQHPHRRRRRADEFQLPERQTKQTIRHRPLPRWVRYIAGVNVLLDVLEMPGIDAVVCGNEPPGPRYDHALGILFAALWYEVNDTPCDPRELLDITERVRREYIEGQAPR